MLRKTRCSEKRALWKTTRCSAPSFMARANTAYTHHNSCLLTTLDMRQSCEMAFLTGGSQSITTGVCARWGCWSLVFLFSSSWPLDTTLWPGQSFWRKSLSWWVAFANCHNDLIGYYCQYRLNLYTGGHYSWIPIQQELKHKSAVRSSRHKA